MIQKILFLMMYILGIHNLNALDLENLKSFINQEKVKILKNNTIQVEFHPTNGKEFFLRTSIDEKTFFNQKENRKYEILYAENLIDQFPTEDEVKVLLIHELFHIRHYIHLNVINFFRFLSQYLINSKHQFEYEFCTDVEMLLYLVDHIQDKIEFQNQINHIIHYRDKVYKLVENSIKSTDIKKQSYLTVEELLRVHNYESFIQSSQTDDRVLKKINALRKNQDHCIDLMK